MRKYDYKKGFQNYILLSVHLKLSFKIWNLPNYRATRLIDLNDSLLIPTFFPSIVK